MPLPSPEDILRCAKATKTRPAYALSELQALRAQAGSQWPQVVLPQEVLAYPVAVEWLMHSGVDLCVERFAAHNQFRDRTLRAMAMFADAPRATHELLDDAGEPHETWDRASRLCVHLNDEMRLEGLREIEREHPAEMRYQMTREHSVAAIKVLNIHLKKNNRKTAAMMRWATSLGARWETPQHEELLKTHARENKKFDRQAYDAFICQLYANELDRQSAPASCSPANRPRL